jgi:hypothetical protein
MRGLRVGGSGVFVFGKKKIFTFGVLCIIEM